MNIFKTCNVRLDLLRRSVMTLRLVYLAAVLGSCTVAGVNTWTSLGPEGGSVTVRGVDPHDSNTVFVAAQHQLFISTNGAVSWKDVSFTKLSVGSLVFDLRAAGVIYAGTWGGGMFRSRDRGVSWQAVNAGLPEQGYVSALTIHPGNSKTLYASVSRNTPTGARTRVYKSVDGAESWSDASSGLPVDSFCCAYSLSIEPQDPDTIYAGEADVESAAPGLYKSTDGGTSWTRSEALAAVASGVNAPLIDPEDPHILYAQACKGTFDLCSWTVYKSTDGGDSWEEASTGLPEDSSLIAIDPQRPGVLYAGTRAGLYRTTNGGASWTLLSSRITGLNNLAFDPRDGVIYSGGLDGVLKSVDGGATWVSSNSGLIATDIWALAIDPQLPGTIYASTHIDGVTLAKSTDSGATWSDIGSGLPVGSRLFSLAVDPRTGALYGATNSGLVGGIFKSTDGGANWVNTGAPISQPSVLAMDPQNPAILYAAGGFGSLFKSTDAGRSWDQVNGPDSYGFIFSPIRALAIDPQDSNNIYTIAGNVRYPLFKSADGGRNFLPATAGLPANSSVEALVIDPQNGGTVYAWVLSPVFGEGVQPRGNLFKSVDRGGQWSAVSPGPPADFMLGCRTCLAIDPQDPRTLYLGTLNGVFRSTDGGANWSGAYTGLTLPYISSLAIDPVNTKKVYAGTLGGGLFAINFDQ